MSERSSLCDAFEDAIQSSDPVTEDNDDVTDGSDSDDTSSYYTAVCSLSDYDEILEDNVCSPCFGPANPPEVETPATVQEFDCKTALLPAPVKEFNSKTAIASVPVEEFDSKTTILPATIEELNCKTALAPAAVQGIDCETAVLPTPVEKLDTKIALLPALVKEFNSKTAGLSAPVEEFNCKTATLSVPVKEFNSETATHPAPVEKLNSKTVLIPAAVQEIGCKTAVLPALVEEFDSKTNLLAAPVEKLNSKRVKLNAPKEEFNTETAILLAPVEIFNSKTALFPAVVTEFNSKSAVLPAPVEELNNKSAVLPEAVKEFNSKSAVLPAPVEELNSKSAVLPAPVEELNSKSTVLPAPVEELNSKSTVLPATVKEFNSKSAVLPAPVEELNGKSAVLPAPVEELNSKSAVLPAAVKEFDSKSAVLPAHVEELNGKSAVLPAPVEELNSKSAVLPAAVKEFDSKSAVLPAPVEELNSKTAVLPAPVEELNSKSAVPPAPVEKLNSKTAVLPAPVEELNSKSAVLPAPVEEFSCKPVLLQVAVQETDSKMSVLPAPVEELNSKTVLIPAAVQEVDSKTAVLPALVEDFDSKTNLLSVPVKKFNRKMVKLSALVEKFSSITALFPAVVKEFNSKTAILSAPVDEFSCNTALRPAAVQAIDSKTSVFPAPVEEFNSKTNLFPGPVKKFNSKTAKHHAPIEEFNSKTTVPPAPVEEFNSKTNVLSAPVKKFNREKDKLFAPIEEFNTKSAAAPVKEFSCKTALLLAVVQEIDSKTSALPALVQEFTSKTVLLPAPVQEIDCKTSALPALVQEFTSKTVLLPAAVQKIDCKTALLPAPVQEIDCKTVVLPAQNSASDPDISNKSFSVLSSCKPVESSLSLDSVSASQRSSLTHHVSSAPSLTCETLKQTAHDSTTKVFQKGSVFLSKPSQSPGINFPSRDIMKASMTTYTDTNTKEGFCFPPPQANFNTILITPERNQYNQDGVREISGKMPTEVPPRQGPCLAEVAGSHMAEWRRLQPMKESLVGVGEGRGTMASCRVEQAELSVRDGNRKASASCISTLTGSARKSGIPPHCYSECILATGQQHQPQSPPELRRWQKQSSQVAWRSRVLPQKLSDSSGKDFSATQQSTGKNNMGTKLSETGSEVKTLSNLPVKTFSCTETNYLDVYNLTCRSYTQPYTESSFNGWAEDEPMAFSPSNHNTSACSEASSVECIDVALETHEEVQRGSMKTVPKRQIQLKRKDTTEPNTNESHSEPQEASPAPSRPRDTFLRQHSTPAAFHQESHGPEQRSVQAERKQRLQKSLSLDETSSRTKMASCLIKNVLSKKMQHEQGFRNADVQENAFASLKNQTNGHDNYQLLSAKEVSTEPTTKMNSSSSIPSQHKVPSHSPPLKGPSGSIKEHISVNSKTQQKPITKHRFNPLHCGLGWTEFQDDGPEITSITDSKKAEKSTPRDEAARLARWSPGEKLSCDSAKAKAWNTSAVISRATGSQACVKATPEECDTAKGNHKQQHIQSQPAPKTWEKDIRKEKPCGNPESPAGPQKIPSLLLDQEKISDKSNQLTPEDSTCPGIEQQTERGDVKVPGQFGNVNTHDKLKGIAPVHVVRDVRSLVKNTYNLSFRGPGDALQALEDSLSALNPASASCKRLGHTGNVFGSADKQLGKKAPTTPPVQAEKMRDINSQHNSPRGGLNKLDMGFTKVSPNSLSAASSCLESNTMEGMNSIGGLCKLDAQSDNPKCKHTDRAERPTQALPEPSAEPLTDGEASDHKQEQLERGSSPAEEHIQPQAVSLHSFAAGSQPYPTPALLKESFQSPSLPPHSQATPACMLTAAITPAQVLPTYYYKANPLSYQAISPCMSAMGFVQGPVILQTSTQPISSTGPSPLVRHISEDGQQAAASCYTEKRQGQKGSPKQTGNGENRGGVREPKMASPEAQPYLCGTQTVVPVLTSEGRRSSMGALHPDFGGGLIQGQAAPRHLLLDPETGRCFYMDVPLQPQRKMLFDPETCQYVEVLLPQQSLPSAVMSPPCALPLPFPAVYTPTCLPYLQSHTQVLPHPGP